MSLIEVGSGTGSSTLALAQAAKSVGCYELSESSTAVARERLGFWGIGNVRFHSALFDEHCQFVQDGGMADGIILYATLEHMTHQECLSILALSWRLLHPGGSLVVAETPNRFSIIDEHTSWLPFFSQLPRELQVMYASHSPRDDFRRAISLATQEDENNRKRALQDPSGSQSGNQFAKGAAIEAMTRWGSGISFHEFELAIGKEVHEYISMDGYEPEITSLFPVSSIDTTLQTLFEQFEVKVHRGFTRRTLFLVIKKPAMS